MAGTGGQDLTNIVTLIIGVALVALLVGHASAAASLLSAGTSGLNAILNTIELTPQNAAVNSSGTSTYLQSIDNALGIANGVNLAGGILGGASGLLNGASNLLGNSTDYGIGGLGGNYGTNYGAFGAYVTPSYSAGSGVLG